MIEYYLAAWDAPDGTRMRRTICGGSARDALRLARDIPADASVKPRDEPVWDPVARTHEDLGRMLSVKEHFLSGGELICDYRGRSYVARPEFWGKDRKVDDGTGRKVVGIGTATFRCREAPEATLRIVLEPLDEQHAGDRLSSALIEWDDEIRAPRPDAPSTSAGASDGMVLGIDEQVRSIVEAELVLVLSRLAFEPGTPADPETLIGETLWTDLVRHVGGIRSAEPGIGAVADRLTFGSVETVRTADGLHALTFLAGDGPHATTVCYDHSDRLFFAGSHGLWTEDREGHLRDAANPAVAYWSQEYARHLGADEAAPAGPRR